jgi:hypothetical protein
MIAQAELKLQLKREDDTQFTQGYTGSRLPYRPHPLAVCCHGCDQLRVHIFEQALG